MKAKGGKAVTCWVGLQTDPEATRTELLWVKLGLKPSPLSLSQCSRWGTGDTPIHTWLPIVTEQWGHSQLPASQDHETALPGSTCDDASDPQSWQDAHHFLVSLSLLSKWLLSQQRSSHTLLPALPPYTGRATPGLMPTLCPAAGGLQVWLPDNGTHRSLLCLEVTMKMGKQNQVSHQQRWGCAW